MKKMLRGIVLAAAAAGVVLGTPAAAFEADGRSGYAAAQAVEVWQHSDRDDWRDRRDRDRRYRDRDYRDYRDRDYRDRDYRGDRDRYYGRSSYDEPVRRDTRVWRGNDGRYYCQKKDGTTGLIIGGAVGALLGREIDRGGSNVVGTLIGGGAGALLGREIARGGLRCN